MTSRIAPLIGFTLLLSLVVSFQSQGQWVQVSGGLVDSTLHVYDQIVVSPSADCVSACSIPSLTGSTIYDCEPAGTSGTIIAGPSADVNGSSSLTFWKVYFSDGVTGWSAGKSLAKTNVTPYINNLAVSGTNLFVSTQNVGGVFRSTNYGTTWTAADSGLTRWSGAGRYSDTWCFAVMGTKVFVGTDDGVCLSTNNGTTWTPVGPTSGYMNVSALAVSGTTLFAGINTDTDGNLAPGVYVTTDGGTTWTGGNIDDVYSLAVNGTSIFAGTLWNGIIRSSDNGSSWHYVNNGLPDLELFVGSFALCGPNLFANVTQWTWSKGYPLGTYRSTDNGAHWTKGDTLGLSSIVAIDSNRCFGIFGGKVCLSINNGTTWTAVNNGLNSLCVNSLAISGAYLFASTGSGVWRMPLSEAVAIQLASFVVNKCSSTSMRVTWTTVSETNNYGFYLQESPDKQNWTDVGALIPGHGTTLDPQKYSVTLPISNGSCWVRLVQVDLDGTSMTSDAQLVQMESPVQFALDQNYPNPFNPSTTIRYGLPAKSHVTLLVYNSLGQQVADLVNGDINAGYSEVKFDGSNLASGAYFYRLQAGTYLQTKKLLLMK